MTIIVFLVDTSASMQQKAYYNNGRSSLLDVAKGAVEFFVKMRQKSAESRGDRYMLLTFDEFPRNLRAGWKENLQTFMTELKNLEANGMTNMGVALKQVFDTLNVNRMQTGIDMYGQGRYPFYLEPAVIIVISDGGKLTTQMGSVLTELNLPMHSAVLGSELTREPFRWDQRLYALVLRMAGTPPMSQDVTGHVASDHSPIDAMCEVTGGRSYAVTSQRVLHQCIDSLVQKLQSGVVIHFEKSGPDPEPIIEVKEDEDSLSSLTRADTLPLEDDESQLNQSKLFPSSVVTKENVITTANSRPHTPNPVLAPTNTAWHNCRKLIYVQRSAQKGFAVGFWPIPESFWPDVNAPNLPQRSAHPNVKFSCADQDPMIIDSLPFDKYELEPSPLTLYILARKQPKYCWQVFIQGSSKNSESGHPFGYVKASSNLLTVNLFVLPYNYPVLLPLLDDLFKVHRLKPSADWRAQFHNYLRTMPTYYTGPLRRALTRMGAGNLASSLLPESMDNCLSYTVLNYLKRVKNQAKLEYDKTLNSASRSRGRGVAENIKVVSRTPFKRDLINSQLFKDKFQSLKDQLTDFPGFAVAVKENNSNTSSRSYNRLKNPFDISRDVLLDQLIRMRSNFLQPSNVIKLMENDVKHARPIGQMGNYQDHLKKMPVPLREIESAPVRQHMFGNPFKISKNMILDEIVDEVGLAVMSNNPNNNGSSPSLMKVGGSNKRINDSPLATPLKRLKKGPLPKDYVYVRTPPSTPKRENDSSDISIEGLNIETLAKKEDIKSEDDRDTLVITESAIQLTTPLVNDSHQINGEPGRLSIRNNSSGSSMNFKSKPLTNGASIKVDESESEDDAFSGIPVDEDQRSSIDPPSPPPASLRSSGNVFRMLQDESSGYIASTITNGSCSDVMSREEVRSVKLRNHNMRQMIYKEVKRPGKDHSKLLLMLTELHGTKDIRREYIFEVIEEAKRFKRRQLAELLKDKMDELVSKVSYSSNANGLFSRI